MALCAIPKVVAQVVPDPAAPANQRAGVLTDGSGRPLVNIQKPSAAGVSRNAYSQFDVRSHGVVLNNARSSNPLLGKDAAKIILNEVNSSRPSHLQGPVSVQGVSAQVVIANPSGIQIDGARFINVSRVTLTTGVPIVENGEFRRVDVRQGLVEVAGKGLDASSTPYTEILSRAARIAARIDAQALHIITGAQDIGQASGVLRPASGAGSAPAVAIDTAALGGMHARSITLLATETGVGVRNDGALRADGETGDLIITSEGWLENTGRLEARGNVRLSATDVTLSGHGPHAGAAVDIGASGNMCIKASRTVDSGPGFSTTVRNPVHITGDNISLRASGDITADGLDAQSGGRLNILADRELVIDGAMREGRTGDMAEGGSSRSSQVFLPSVLSGVHGVTLGAAGDLTLIGADVRAERGAVQFKARGNIELKTAQNTTLVETVSVQNEPDWSGFGEVSKSVMHRHESRTIRHAAVQGRDIRIAAEKDIRIHAARLSADRRLHVEAGGDVGYLAARIQADTLDLGTASSRLSGIEYHLASVSERSETVADEAVRLHGGKEVRSRSGGGQILQGTEVSHQGVAAFEAGVGAHARSGASLVLSSAIGSKTYQHSSKRRNAFWDAAAEQGSVVETSLMPSFSGSGDVVLTALGGLEVQVADGDESMLKNAETLGKPPGMRYLSELAKRKDVSWQRLRLSGSQWDDTRQGLTPAGAALLATGVTWGTAGMGAGLTGAVQGGTLGTLSNVAFARFASLSAIAWASNVGDMGATLAEMSSAATLSATATAGISAGLLLGMSKLASVATLRNSLTLKDRFVLHLLNASGRTMVSAAINGGSLTTMLNAALRDATLDTLQGALQGKVRNAEVDYMSRKLGYALVGCVAGEAGSGSCAGGAIGSIAVDIASDVLSGQRPGAKASRDERFAYEVRLLALSKTIAGVASVYSRSNTTEAVSAADTIVRLRGLP